MTPRTKQVAVWLGGSVLGGGLALATIGMAVQFWISTEVTAQLVTGLEHDHSNTTQIVADVATIKTKVENNGENIGRALESQQRFEELFIEYLQRQAENN
jgi:hypothetical protein